MSEQDLRREIFALRREVAELRRLIGRIPLRPAIGGGGGGGGPFIRVATYADLPRRNRNAEKIYITEDTKEMWWWDDVEWRWLQPVRRRGASSVTESGVLPGAPMVTSDGGGPTNDPGWTGVYTQDGWKPVSHWWECWGDDT